MKEKSLKSWELYSIAVLFHVTGVCRHLNNYGFQRVKTNYFVYAFCMVNIVRFDSLKAITVQTPAN